MRIYLGAQTNPGRTHADNKAVGRAMQGMKIYLCMGGPSEGSNAGTHAVSNAMKIYLGMAHGGTGTRESLTYGSPGFIARAVQEVPDLPTLRILLSFHYYRDENVAELLKECFGDLKVDVFADSGAYSAMTMGKPIIEADYIAWVNRWKACFTAASAPDVIGAPSASEAATERMLEQVEGVPVLPVFHIGEPWSFLERWVNDTRIDYLALGGMVPFTRRLKLLDAWLTKAFTIIPPRVRVHGFGLTTWPMLLRHPFYSVDSSSWTAGFRYASLQLFDDARGKFIDVAMGQTNELLRHAKLLESYGIRPSQAQAASYERDLVIAVAVASWHRAEAWIAKKKAKPINVHLAVGGNPAGPNVAGKLGTGAGDIRSLGTGLGTRTKGRTA